MSITHTLGKTWAGGAGSVGIQKTTVLTSDLELNIDTSIAASTTNEALAWAFVKAKLQSVFITTDNALTLKTNSSGSPQDTITLAAGGVYEWDVNSGITNPFVGDVTSLFVTNGSGSLAANLSIRTLVSH